MSFINPFCILLCPYLVSEPAKCLLTQYETRGRPGQAPKFQFPLPWPVAFPAASELGRSVSSDKGLSHSLPARSGSADASVWGGEKKGTSRSAKKGICWTSGSDTETVEAPHHQVGSDKRGCLRRLLWKVKKATWYAFRKETPPNDINVRCILGWKYLWCNLSLILPFFKHLLHPLLNISFPSSEAPSPKCQLNLY